MTGKEMIQKIMEIVKDSGDVPTPCDECKNNLRAHCEQPGLMVIPYDHEWIGIEYLDDADEVIYICGGFEPKEEK